MNNIDLVLVNPKVTNKVFGDKKNTASTSAAKNFYQTLMDSATERAKEAENKKKKRLNLIIQKLLAGITLTGDELQFLKNTAPMYFNQAMQQQKSHKEKNAVRHGISAIEPISIV